MSWNVRASGGKNCFEIDQEMDAILLIIGIVCRIVIKSVQQCTYFLFTVNLLLVDVNYGQRTMQVSEVCSSVILLLLLQGNNKSMVIFVLKRRKVVR